LGHTSKNLIFAGLLPVKIERKLLFTVIIINESSYFSRVLSLVQTDNVQFESTEIRMELKAFRAKKGRLERGPIILRG
jgi:hypothetical protein